MGERVAHVNKLTVAEVTSRGKGYPTEVPLGQMANLSRESFVQLDNVQTVPKSRFVNRSRGLPVIAFDPGSHKMKG